VEKIPILVELLVFINHYPMVSVPGKQSYRRGIFFSNKNHNSEGSERLIVTYCGISRSCLMKKEYKKYGGHCPYKHIAMDPSNSYDEYQGSVHSLKSHTKKMPWITLTVCKMQKVGPLYS
jgi:hypothetical protein